MLCWNDTYTACFLSSKEDWRTTASHLIARSQPNDAVLCYGFYGEYPLTYYLKFHPGAEEHLRFVHLSVSPDPFQGNLVSPPDYHVIEQLPQKYTRVWLILTHHSVPESEKIKGALTTNYTLIYSGATSDRRIQILLYQKP